MKTTTRYKETPSAEVAPPSQNGHPAADGLESSKSAEPSERLAQENKRLAQENARLAQEQALERSLLRTLIDNLPDAIFAKDTAGRKTMANPADLKKLHCKAETEAIGKSDFDFFPKDVAEKFWASDQKVLQGQPIIDQEGYFLNDKGEKHWQLTSKLPLRDQNGIITGLVGISRDITDQKQAEEALRQSRDELEKRVAERTAELSQERLLLRTLIDSVPDSIYAKDTAGRKTMANLGDLKNLKCKTEAEVIGKSDFDFFPKDIAEKFRADDQKVLQGQPVINQEEQVLDEKGRKRWLLTSKLPLHDPNGKIIGLVGIGREITEHKLAEEALANERALLHTLVDHLPAAIYLKDLEGRKTLANRVELDYMGATSEAEVLGKTDFDFFPPEKAAVFRAHDQEIIRTGQPLINDESLFTKPDGSVIYLSGSTVPLRDAAGRVTGLAGINYDITDRKRVEEALRQSEERLLKVITQSRCILSFGYAEGPAGWRERALDAESAFHWDFPVLNEEAAQKVLPLNQATGERYQEAWTRSWYHDDAAQMNRNAGKAFLNDLPFYRNEVRCTDINGVEHWMQEFVTIRKLAENRWELFGITTDISDLKKVEAELRQTQNGLEKRVAERTAELSQERRLLHTLINNLPDGVYIKNIAGRKTMANSAELKILGCKTEAEVIGKSDFDLFPKDVAEKISADDQKVIQGEPVLNREECDRGKKRWLLTSKLPLRDQNGIITGLVGINRDITDQKQAEEALRQSRDELEKRVAERTNELSRERLLLRTLIDSLPDAIYAKDAAGRKTMANPGDLSNLKCKTEAEVLGKSDFDFFPKDIAEKFQADDQKVMQGEPVIDREEYFLSDKGEKSWLLTSKLPLRDQNGTIMGLVGIGRNITERKLAEDALRSSEEKLRQFAGQLERSNRELQDFAYVASHDLQEPLRKIVVFGERLKEKSTETLAPESLDYLDRMQKAAGRMQILINDLLTFSRVTTKAHPFAPVNLTETASEVVNDLEGRIELVKGRVEVGPLPVIDADGLQMRQLLQNLIGNALKFRRPEEPPVVKVEAQIISAPDTPEKKLCQLTISDNGIGFDEKYLDRIFNVFQRLHTRNEYEGTGMGLAIVRKIALYHGGDITAKSKLGQGSSFILTLPVVHPKKAQDNNTETTTNKENKP